MESTTLNPWAQPSPDEASSMAAFLEQRSAYPDQVAVNTALIDAANPQPGQRWLDLGCGSRALTRLLADRVAPTGAAVGLDISQAMLAGGHSPVALDTAATAYHLPFPDAAFDGTLSARLLLHLQHPQAAIAEMARVTRPGGALSLMDWDFDTLALDHSDRELTRTILHWRCDNHGGNNWSGRQLYRRMKTAGLHDVHLHPVPSIAQDRQTSLALTALRCAHRALDGGGISMEAYVRWTEELEQRLSEGTFFASIVYFIATGIVE